MRKAWIPVLMMLVAVDAFAGGDGLITRPSRYTVPETMDRLVSVLQSKGMTIFDRIDHAAAAEKAGLSMRPSQLLIFGNPKGGTPLMVAAPTAAIDLPLKALAWEDASGKVWLSYNSPAWIKDRHAIRGKDEAIAGTEKALEAMAGKALE